MPAQRLVLSQQTLQTIQPIDAKCSRFLSFRLLRDRGGEVRNKWALLVCFGLGHRV